MQHHVSVRRAGLIDEQEIAKFQAAFDYPILSDETRRFLDDERHHLLLGYLDAEPAGFLSGVEVFHPDKRPELFLNEIAVIESARRLGVARALIQEFKLIGEARGCTSIWVLTDERNQPAMALYGSTGGEWSGEHHVMFEYPIRQQR